MDHFKIEVKFTVKGSDLFINRKLTINVRTTKCKIKTISTKMVKYPDIPFTGFNT